MQEDLASPAAHASRRDGRPGPWRPLVLLCALLPGLWACETLRYPSDDAAEPTRSGTASASPSPDSPAGATWVVRAQAGRDELRAGNLQDAEDHFLAALAATRELRPDDARAQAALRNLLHLGEAYQRRGLYEDSARIANLLFAESSLSRGPDFASAAPLLLRQGLHCEQAERRSDAEDLYVSGLALRAAGPQAGDDYFSMRMRLGRLLVSDARFEEASRVLQDLLAELGERRVGTRVGARAALVAAEAGRGETASAELHYGIAREDAQAAGPELLAALAPELQNLAAGLRASGREDEARFLESLAAR